MKFRLKLPKLAHIPPEDRVPLKQKIAFGFGQNTEFFGSGIITNLLWLPFFNIGLGINPIALGVVLMAIRIWDAISDPIAGNFSDNIRTRWGRRRPVMFVSAFTSALIFPLIWHLPQSVRDGTSWLGRLVEWIPYFDQLSLSPAETSTTVYLLIIGIVYFTSFTFWSMSFYGLQLELTPNYDERTRLNVVITLMVKIGTFFTSWAFAAIVFIGSAAQGDLSSLENKPSWIVSIVEWAQPLLASLAGDAGSEKPIVTGMRIFSWFVALTIIAFGTAPALFVKERYYDTEASKQPKTSIWKSLKESVSCLPLWSLITVSFLVVMGYTSIGGLGTYVNIYYVCEGDMLEAGAITGLKGSIIAVTGICLLPFFTWLGERFDKRFAVILLLITSAVGHLLNIVLMTPAYPYLQVVSGFFEATALGAFWLYLPSMKADVVDWDEIKTRRRREGSLNALYSWFIKLSLTLSMGIGGAVLSFSGYDASLEMQTEETISRMFIIFLIIPTLLWLVALIPMQLYPLSRKQSESIRQELEARRGAI